MEFNTFIYKQKNNEVKISTIKQKSDNYQGAYLYPGAGYPTFAPLFYYITNLLLEENINVTNFEYDFRIFNPFISNKISYSEYSLFLESYFINNKSKDNIAICKSIGSKILASGNLDLYSKIIWLTPAINEKIVYDAIAQTSKKSYVIIGTQDNFYSEEKINRLKDNSANCLIINGADHGLDIEGDILGSISSLKLIIGLIKNFLRK